MVLESSLRLENELVGSRGPSASVLLAEDDPANRFVLQTYLEKLGLVVRTAANGIETLRLLASERFDLVILDIVLPGVDGVEIMRRLRAPGHPLRDVPVLVQTGRATREDVDIFRQAGCTDCIFKPYKPEDIMGKVVELLGSRVFAL